MKSPSLSTHFSADGKSGAYGIFGTKISLELYTMLQYSLNKLGLLTSCSVLVSHLGQRCMYEVPASPLVVLFSVKLHISFPQCVSRDGNSSL